MKCDACGREIKPNEFMAVLAKFPEKDHVGRTDAIIKKWVKTTDGAIYCKACFENKFGSD
ncbi:hypothetical protein GCM10028778_24220 [Barrientosiimonas marina]|uniref:Fe3+ hydroxamate ABC transporter substrate-binding protein n=1 Tax=Lentibacillus kimchii TaxID=1542911 RepID=A0ABW2UY98_9BACI